MTARGNTKIVAGRRIIDENHGCYLAGYDINMSINNESTVLENDASMIDDTMVRKWTKDGLSAKEIREKQMENVRRVHAAAQSNLERQTHGVREFKDLLEIYDKQATKKNDNIFAVPALPMSKNMSIGETSFEQASNLGRVGLSCSTPIVANSSMRVLRTLDISQVGTAESNRKSGHQVFQIPSTESSESQKTDTIQTEESTRATFTIDKGAEESNINSRATFTVEENVSLQGTITINKDSGRETFTIDTDSLQSTFVKESEAVIEKEVPVVAEVLQGGKKTRKVNLEERQKRNESMSKSNSLLLTSMMEDAPSPGAKLFNMKKKKMRPTVEEVKAPLKQTKAPRLSTESDKEQSIHMLTIEESSGVESIVSSYIDPSSVDNGSTINSILEEEEEMEETQEKEGTEKVTVQPASQLESVVVKKEIEEDTVEVSVTAVIVERSPLIMNAFKKANIDIAPDIDIPIPPIHEEESLNVEGEEGTRRVDITDYADIPHIDNYIPQSDSPDMTHRTPISTRKSKRVRVLVEDSMDETPQIGGNDTQDDMDTSDEDSDGEGPSNGRQTRGRKKTVVGLRLAKRQIIKPEEVDGLRRSTRTRCKPLRSWLGEKGVYVDSPHGGRRLKGVTDVVITDKRYCKYRTADPKLATERQMKERAHKKARAVERRRKLAEQHRRGQNLNMTQEEIVTSDDE